MVLVSQLQPARSIHIKELKYLVTYQIKIHILLKKSLKNKNYFVPITGSKMAAAARISLHIHKLVSKKGHWFLKKAKILPKLFESLVNIVTSFVWLRLYWLRLRRNTPSPWEILTRTRNQGPSREGTTTEFHSSTSRTPLVD